MSYVVLARKWRPQRFDDLTGQQHVAQTLKNAIEQDRVPHAMLFTGARGVGKTSTARILAMALNCSTNDGGVDPCGTCPSCEEIQRSQSVDVLEIDGASNRGINEIRELRDGVRYAPQRDRFKVYIIDEVHMLTTEAFNALLKTLEEPPQHVVFVFATTEAQKIPVTILSRCQRFDFRRIPLPEIVARLADIAAAENLNADADVLGIIGRQAAGGMRDALSLMDQVIAFAGTDITLDRAAAILGVAERRRLFELSDALIDRDIDRALQVVADVVAYGVDMPHFSQELVGHLRDLAIVAVSRDPETLTTLTDGELEEARAQVGRSDRHTLHRMFELMVDAAEEIARSNQATLLFEMVLVRMAALEPMADLNTLIDRLEALADGRTLGAPGGGGNPGAKPNDRGPASPAPRSARSAPSAAPAARAEVQGAVAASDKTDADASEDEADPEPARSYTLDPDVPATPGGTGERGREGDLETAGAAAPEPRAAPQSDEAATEAAPQSEAATEAAPRSDEAEAPSRRGTETAAAAAETAPGGAEASSAVDPAATTGAPARGEVPRDGTPLDGLTPAITAGAWRRMVDQVRGEVPHAGRLLATATAVSDSDGLRLGLPPALIARVDHSILTQLDALCQQQAGAKVAIEVVDQALLTEADRLAGYHVAGDEAREERERVAAVRQYVQEHDVTKRILSGWPGARISKIDVTRLEESSR